MKLDRSVRITLPCQPCLGSPLVLKTGLISQANGSGYIEAGGVKIACSV